MWLITFGLPALILIVAGLLLGGAWAFVFIPIAVIVVLGGGGFTLARASRHRETIPGEREPIRPLPHTGHANTAAAPSTPDQLVDARRTEQ
jgi:hypothetical protein